MQRRIENINAQRPDADPHLGQHPSRQRGEHVVFGRGQVAGRNQSLHVTGAFGRHLLRELELRWLTVEIVEAPQPQARPVQVTVGDLAPPGDSGFWRRLG